ncbi:MAG: DUF4199 domain-containing protein [Candidatus Cyclobacteriaceae bacterium M2_1C_046]
MPQTLKKDIKIERVAVKYGTITAVGFIAFFILMRLLGLAQILELRSLNFLILFAGIFLAIRYESMKNPDFAYFTGLATGIATAGISLIIFCVFLAIYLDLIDPAFMQQIKEHEMFGHLLNPYIASVAILFEGALSGVLISFILMQYFKKSHLGSEEKL